MSEQSKSSSRSAQLGAQYAALREAYWQQARERGSLYLTGGQEAQLRALASDWQQAKLAESEAPSEGASLAAYELLRVAAEREEGPGLYFTPGELEGLRELAGRLLEGASEEGREAAEAAASWVTDGNQASGSRLTLLAQLQEGDPWAYDSLPSEPSLSGEYADSPTPRSLRAELSAGEELPELTLEEEGELEGLLADCWEEGSSERFQEACEERLLKAEGLSGLTAAELAREYRERQERYGQEAASAGSAGLLPEAERELRLLAQLWQAALSLEQGAGKGEGS